MPIMDLDEITEMLKTVNNQPTLDTSITCLSLCKEQKVWPGADYSLLYTAWEHETHSEAGYRVKWPRYTGPGLLSVTAELICARIGRNLFSVPLCPPLAIAEPLPDKYTRGFGSKNIVNCKEPVHLVNDSDLTEVKNINSSLLARIIVYHLWLVADDGEILISKDGKQAFSIDHGFFLKWNNENMPTAVYTDLLTAVDDNTIEDALDELESIEQERIVDQFACIPEEWLSSGIKGVAFLTEKILQRRAEVRAKVTRMRSL